MKNEKNIILFAILLIVCVGIVIVSKTNKTEKYVEENNSVTSEIIIDTKEKLKFDKNDSIIKDIKLGMSPDEIKEKMGEPEKIEHQEKSDYIIFETMTYYYPDLIMSFNKTTDKGGLALTEVQITGSNVKLNNNLSVGSSDNDVINSYYNDNQERKYGDELSKEEWAMFLYGDYLYTYSQGYRIPEKYEQTAYINLETNCISYECYELSKEGILEYTKLIFYLNDRNEVSNISWGRYRHI